ncbi:MAG: hypothetical protein JWO80_472 [Bryobacterales bacterium]|nr:hypothetical protein [Bryobacterales bacterium]
MDFTSFKFCIFLTVVGVAYRLAPARFRVGLILAASYAFYWTWSGSLATLMLAATACAYIAARRIQTAQNDSAKRWTMFAAVSAFVALLAIFKTTFLWRDIFKHDLLIPLGISYYTFKLISYVVDVYWGKMRAEKSFLALASYASFFPQIVAGPIQRSESFLEEIHRAPAARLPDVMTGVQRILLGYFKKFVVADNLETLVNFVYGHVYGRGTPLALGFYAYPLQLYADFGGLTDIAVGSALVLGIETPENFYAPFAAHNISEYWRRWHISLTSWLTDYVFTPLRMATRNWGNVGLIFSLTVNLVLIGVWHGVRWEFALFGLLHAFYLSVDALSARWRKRFYKAHPSTDRAMNWIGPVVTFHLVAIGAVFFRGERVSDIFYLLGHLGSGIRFPSAEFRGLMDVSGRSILIGFGGYVLLEIADYFRRRNRRGELVESLPRWGRWSVYSCTAVTVVFVIMLLLAGGESRNPFLYAIF